ncbi:MAG TPA: alpha/beta fold hydrolase [Myxococcota bacterium]|nr:alpha/beta fold hydrolase [Myxococcota bacterium]
MTSNPVSPTGLVRLWTVAPSEAGERAEQVVRPVAPLAPHAGGPPRTVSPLDAAFRRPTLMTEVINEETEGEILERQGGPALVAYRQLDPRARPVVLVHGVNSSGAELTALADQLTQAGRQVYIFAYNDNGHSTTESGQHLARELRQLYANTQHRDEPLEIVGHSMGGIVARIALNHLQQSGTPRAGFPSVRVQNMDTSQAGQYDGPTWTQPWLPRLIGMFMRWFGHAGLTDMMASSPMWEGLYATDLPRVSISNIAARSPDGRAGLSHNLYDFSRPDRSAIATYLTGGALPGEPMARNYARALQSDAYAQVLRARLEVEMRTQPPDEAMLAAFNAVMPQYQGSHVDIASDPRSGALERIVTLLAAD